MLEKHISTKKKRKYNRQSRKKRRNKERFDKFINNFKIHSIESNDNQENIILENNNPLLNYDIIHKSEFDNIDIHDNNISFYNRMISIFF